jgi:flagellar motor switch protein FliN
MIVDQSEIDALLAEADGLAASAGELAQPPPPPRALPAPASRIPADPQLARLLKLHVPVIVQLARRRMPIGSVLTLSVGAIIEFEKSVEDHLDLLINNHAVGRGQCVKVGENFGLRITEICGKAQRIRSLRG